MTNPKTNDTHYTEVSQQNPDLNTANTNATDIQPRATQQNHGRQQSTWTKKKILTILSGLCFLVFIGTIIMYKGLNSSSNRSQNNLGYGGCTIGTVVERDCFDIRTMKLPPCQKAFQVVENWLRELPKESMPSPMQIISAIRTIGKMCVE